MIAARILAVLSAALLILAVALATFGVRAMTLDAALGSFDRGFVDALQAWVGRNLGPWTWARLVQPFLVRPAWLLPACIGLVLSGLALTLSRRDKPRRSHRRG